MSLNRDYRTQDHATRYALREHGDLTLALQAGGVDAASASRIAFREVNRESAASMVRKGRKLARRRP